MALAPLSDDELDAMIRARLASIGIDIDQLPPGSASDPVTGSPGRDAALASLRSFVRGTVATLSGYRLPPAVAGSDDDALAQQSVPPELYPVLAHARRAS